MRTKCPDDADKVSAPMNQILPGSMKAGCPSGRTTPDTLRDNTRKLLILLADTPKADQVSGQPVLSACFSVVKSHRFSVLGIADKVSGQCFFRLRRTPSPPLGGGSDCPGEGLSGVVWRDSSMTQGQLFRAPKQERTVSRQRDQYEAGNLRSAREIIANPDQHDGPDAFPVVWALRALARLERKAAA